MGRVLVAVGGSLLGHGAVLAAVLLAPSTSPPVPAPPVLVELVGEPGGTGREAEPGPPPLAGGGAAATQAPPPAPDPDPHAADLAPPRPAREAAVERAAAKPAKGVRDRANRSAAERAGPRQIAALPTGAGKPQADPAGSLADRGEEAGTGPGSGQGGSAAGAERAAEAPGFAPGSADNPLPRYPTVARRRGIEGTVTLEVWVDGAGLPERVALARSSGSSLLDEAALETVRRWRFRPALRAGEPVAGIVTVPITFRLLEPDRAALR